MGVVRVAAAIVVMTAVAGCFDFSGPWDLSCHGCEGHAGSNRSGGLFFGCPDCGCPLATDILDGTAAGGACTQRGLECRAGFFAPVTCTCEFEPLTWSCGAAADLSMPMPPADLSSLPRDDANLGSD